MTSDSQDEDSAVAGEPIKEEWVGSICVEKYDDAIRLVQPREDQLVPESIIVPNEDVEWVAGLMNELESTTVIQS